MLMSTQSTRELLLEEITTLIDNFSLNFDSKSSTYRAIEKEIDYSERSLRRVLSGKSIPHPRTTLNILRLCADKFEDDLELVKSIQNKYPSLYQYILKEFTELTLNPPKSQSVQSVDKKIETDSIYRGIFILVYSGGSTVEEIKNEYGIAGLRTLEAMIEEKVVVTNEDNQIKVGSVCPTGNFKSEAKISEDLIGNHFKTSNLGHLERNYMRNFMFPVNKKGYKRLIQIEEMATKLKLEALRDNQFTNNPDMRYFAVTYVDTVGTPFEQSDRKGDEQ